jgi:hypothetical protein
MDKNFIRSSYLGLNTQMQLKIHQTIQNDFVTGNDCVKKYHRNPQENPSSM